MNMHDIWSKRFAHYINELQKYMQYIFTGHIAVVIVFVLGALGYQYSEWLKNADPTFPAVGITAVIVGLVAAFSRPTTLIREPDQVYLLPLESSMKLYFQKALNWTFFSQILVPVVLYIVAIPLLRAITILSVKEIWIGLLFIVLIKYINVHAEFSYRYANRGRATYIDRMARIVLNILILESYLNGGVVDGLIFTALLIIYYVTLRKKVYVEPVPYEHFVKIEQNRMLGFYRFANYFTDVPHLRGSVKRRAWLDVVYKWIPFKKENTQSYLIARTFIRTDDLFYLWLRLTAIAAIFAAFIAIQVVTWIVSAALVFAMVIQLKQALNTKGEFRMDMLFPGKAEAREKAVEQFLYKLVVVQAVIVTLCNVMMPHFYVTLIITLAVGFITIKLSKSSK